MDVDAGNQWANWKGQLQPVNGPFTKLWETIRLCLKFTSVVVNWVMSFVVAVPGAITGLTVCFSCIVCVIDGFSIVCALDGLGTLYFSRSYELFGPWAFFWSSISFVEQDCFEGRLWSDRPLSTSGGLEVFMLTARGASLILGITVLLCL